MENNQRKIKGNKVFKKNSVFQEHIQEIIRTHPGASVNEISYLLDASKLKVEKNIKLLEQKKIIRIVRDAEDHILCYLGKGFQYEPSKVYKKGIVVAME